MRIMNPIGKFLPRSYGGEAAVEEVALHGRSVALHLSPRAEAALARRDEPLTVELELFFSCLIRTRVRFPEESGSPVPDAETRPTVDGRLRLRFRPVMSRHCSLEEGHQLTGFPLARPGPFVPHWVRLDYRPDSGWVGELGYAGGRYHRGETAA